MLALRLLLLGEFRVQHLAFAALALERRIAAAIEGELAVLQMQDGIHRVVEQVAIMADDDDGVRVAGEVIFQPERAFEIEIVGRLVEQQEIGRGEQRGGERHPHPPAAGKFRDRARLIRGREAEAGQDRGRARRRRMRIDIGEPGVDVGDPVRVGGVLGFVEQRGPLQVGGEHDVDQAVRAARRFLQQTPDPGALAHGQACRIQGRGRR